MWLTGPKIALHFSCLFVCWFVTLCVRTCCRNKYVTYITAMQLYFSRLWIRQLLWKWSTGVATTSSLARLWVRDTEKQKQCRHNGARLTNRWNARSEQLLVMPTELLTDWEWLPAGDLQNAQKVWPVVRYENNIRLVHDWRPFTSCATEQQAIHYTRIWTKMIMLQSKFHF